MYLERSLSYRIYLKKHELKIEWKLFKNLTKEERETIRLSFD